VPVYVGGVSEAALRRAARHDGWVSDLHTIEELAAIRAQIERYREEYGRTDVPFSVFGAARDAWDLDGYRRVHEAGVTHLITMPWYFYAGAEADLAGKIDGIKRFADDVIAKW
jgi:alkanesulfonate monooxygenase SsuD/methylene tetrahydromethanopterin reductase-like flavin-dependent oxidoreductase (luciferase family)